MFVIMFAAHDTFARLGARRLLSEGEILFRLGDPIHSMFVVEEGEVRLVRHLPHGPTLTLQIVDAQPPVAAQQRAASLHPDQAKLVAIRLSRHVETACVG